MTTNVAGGPAKRARRRAARSAQPFTDRDVRLFAALTFMLQSTDEVTKKAGYVVSSNTRKKNVLPSLERLAERGFAERVMRGDGRPMWRRKAR